MAKDLFSVPIFFILFRETLEASIIVSVLLALVEQLVTSKQTHGADSYAGESTLVSQSEHIPKRERSVEEKRLLRKLRIQIFAGAALGLLIALAIGAAFIAVFYTKVRDLWADSEDLWEGIFSLIAALMILVMGITMLRIDRAKILWRIKLQKAFNKNANIQGAAESKVHKSRSSKYALFLLPFVTVLREGIEAVVFLGGVSLSEPATSIPIAAIVGLLCGIVVGYLLYKSSSRLNLSFFLTVSTCFLLLIGAGLMSRSCGYFETYKYVQLVGGDVAETGTGPGSYSVHGNVWHLDCCNPEGNNGWSIFNAILGWTNNATVGTILCYIIYWLVVIVSLLYMKWSEGRMRIFNLKSAAWHRREERRLLKAAQKSPELPETPTSEDAKKVGMPEASDPAAKDGHVLTSV